MVEGNGQDIVVRKKCSNSRGRLLTRIPAVSFSLLWQKLQQAACQAGAGAA